MLPANGIGCRNCATARFGAVSQYDLLNCGGRSSRCGHLVVAARFDFKWQWTSVVDTGSVGSIGRLVCFMAPVRSTGKPSIAQENSTERVNQEPA